MSTLKEFGVYLLKQEAIRQSSNTGVEALTVEQIAELHAASFEVEGEEIKIVLTEEDFTNNPELSEVVDETGAPLKVGDEVGIVIDTNLSVNEAGELQA
jgi:hypothetical protein